MHLGDHMSNDYEIPETTARKLAHYRLHGFCFIGNPDTVIKRVYVTGHILGHLSDSDSISKINDEDINCLITPELVNFTVAEYIRDEGMLKEDRCIFAHDHFNYEEIRIEWYAGYLW